MQPVDLRSDTVTLPTAAMRHAMLNAEVGDDVYGEDPSVNALEARVATIFGHEDALFCASGTMANQIAINVHTGPGDEVICDEGAHVYRYEGGGIMANSGCSVKLLTGDRGRFTADQVAGVIQAPGNPHFPRTRLVVVENSSNRGGGSVWDLREVRRIHALCQGHGLALHLDGARIFNAMAVDGTRPTQWGEQADSISICLSKGLGAPVGSMLTGTKEFVARARRVRKRWGGGMRQAGFLAAAGLYALEHHVHRLADDHRRARKIADALAHCSLVDHTLPVETNIVIAHLRPECGVADFLDSLKQHGIWAAEFGPGMVRFVTHLGIGNEEMARIEEALHALG